MDIKLINKELYWDFRTIVDEYENSKKIDLSKIKEDIENLIHSAESCKNMIDNREELSDIEFYNMLNEFANIINWNDYDCYNVIEMYYNTTFEGIATLKTSMQYTDIKTEGQGNDFSWWKEKVGISFKVLHTKDFRVDYKHIYTIEEIQQLIKENKIVIINEKERHLSYDDEDDIKENYQAEDYKEFDCTYDPNNINFDFFNKKGKYFPYTLKYIKETISNKKLKKIFPEYLDHINYEIYDITDKNWQKESHRYITEEWIKEFEQSGYIKRLQKLNDSSFE